MPDESQSLQDFQHLHEDGLKNLEIEKSRLAEANSRASLPGLDDDLLATISKISQALSAEAEKGPDAIFRTAVRWFGDLDAKRFLIGNLIEAAKHGKTVAQVLTDFANLGLIQKAQSPPSPFATTATLLERKSLIERAMTVLGQISVNALKTVPKWVEIEPHFTVFPIPSLGFSLKGKGMSAYDLFEALRGARPDKPAQTQ